MDAAARGVASVSNAISIGLLPGLDAAASSPAVTIPITTGLGEVRNVVLAYSCRAMIAIGGGYGTLTEISFALYLHKPLALIDSWEFTHASINTDPSSTRFFTVPHDAADSTMAPAKRDAHAAKSAADAVNWVFDQLGE